MIIKNQMVVFGQFISQKLVNLHFIWVVGPFGTLKAAWFFRSKRVQHLHTLDELAVKVLK
jgi:hypothetical protein